MKMMFNQNRSIYKMKKMILRNTMLLAILSIATMSLAQTDPALIDSLRARAAADTLPGWRTSGVININFTQVKLINWAAGGFSSISGIAQ